MHLCIIDDDAFMVVAVVDLFMLFSHLEKYTLFTTNYIGDNSPWKAKSSMMSIQFINSMFKKNLQLNYFHAVFNQKEYSNNTPPPHHQQRTGAAQYFSRACLEMHAMS